MGNSIKETFLTMKGWQQLYGTCCIGCDREVRMGVKPSNYFIAHNWLNMVTAPHWPMCTEHAFIAQVGSDNGLWNQSMFYSGNTW